MGYINTTPSKTAFDVLDVSLLSKINLINLFASYRGKPRLFEIEAIAGMGWLHYYVGNYIRINLRNFANKTKS